MNNTWDMVAAQLHFLPRGQFVRVEKRCVTHPLDAGFRKTLGLPRGQRADFRLELANCVGLHVQDFGSHYEAHLDQVDPACDVAEHLRRDAPGTYVLGAVGLGALIGLAIGQSKEAALAGSVLGGLLGLGTAARDDA
ncbi:MAG TPA: hypothetical protein RMH85_01285 [Polyangiaceae bacterium LLY-WYZ-15_(1-7)]|nr:hypothetical protein [Polyangiaceae bacterium LLY-WYZ-15_(1-7)]HJL00455.1 hypothetical protein [Polyangiaceae bacterium LLY-WYZ-15_(1-7)]HJL07096.1 hypothetical protein [Polyangiaceae bacterium LLY-WYZ-15_(1-7)]HJL25268.1 hypothetical protein [Polyangiaceae bacterium LLY-WYZ-15_(1-7)]HJL28904.1 hypothetical protein [Polyangiaceae bacterium LLY-WYZ-15_(1-7)]